MVAKIFKKQFHRFLIKLKISFFVLVVVIIVAVYIVFSCGQQMLFQHLLRQLLLLCFLSLLFVWVGGWAGLQSHFCV